MQACVLQTACMPSMHVSTDIPGTGRGAVNALQSRCRPASKRLKRTSCSRCHVQSSMHASVFGLYSTLHQWRCILHCIPTPWSHISPPHCCWASLLANGGRRTLAALKTCLLIYSTMLSLLLNQRRGQGGESCKSSSILQLWVGFKIFQIEAFLRGCRLLTFYEHEEAEGPICVH